MERKASAHFTQETRFFTTDDNTKHLYKDGTGPYEYLMGALAGCFFSTLEDFDHHCTWKEVTVNASCTKRETIPMTMNHGTLELVVNGCTDKEEFEELVKKSAAECSIYATLSKVGPIDIAVRFEDDEE